MCVIVRSLHVLNIRIATQYSQGLVASKPKSDQDLAAILAWATDRRSPRPLEMNLLCAQEMTARVRQCKTGVPMQCCAMLPLQAWLQTALLAVAISQAGHGTGMAPATPAKSSAA